MINYVLSQEGASLSHGSFSVVSLICCQFIFTRQLDNEQPEHHGLQLSHLYTVSFAVL